MCGVCRRFAGQSLVLGSITLGARTSLGECPGQAMSFQPITEILQAVSSLALIAGFSYAILVFILDRRKARENEIHEIYVLLGDSYMGFVRLSLVAPDLRIWDKHENDGLSPKELSQKWALFEVLISLFERAYMFRDTLGVDSKTARYWRTWESFIRRWCARRDFSDWLPELLQDEDPAFASYMLVLRDAQANRSPRNFEVGVGAPADRGQ